MRISSFFADTKPFGRLLGLFFLVLLCMMVSMPIYSLAPGEGVDPEGVRLTLLCQGLGQMVSFLLPAWLFVVLFHGQPSRFFRLAAGGRQGLLALIAVVVLLLLAPAIDWLSVWNDGWNLGAWEEPMRSLTRKTTEITSRMLSGTTVEDLLLQCLVVALVPAVCEEFFFRGALQPTLQTLVRNKTAGLLLTAFLFSAVHGDLYGLVPRFVLGCLLGCLYQYSGSMWVNVSVHFFNNLIVVLGYWLYNRGVSPMVPSDPLALPWTLTLLCTVGAMWLIYFYFLKTDSK